MLTKELKYTDFNDEERTEKHYFNLSQVELTEMQLGQRGGMEAYIQRIIDTQDQRQIVDLLKNFVRASYGKRSDDGASFLKSFEIWQYFQGSGAYEALFLEILADPEKVEEFMIGIIPEKLRTEAANRKLDQSAKPGFRPGADTTRPTPPVAAPQQALPSAIPNDPSQTVAPADPTPTLPVQQPLQGSPEPEQIVATPDGVTGGPVQNPAPVFQDAPPADPTPAQAPTDPTQGFQPSQTAYLPPEDSGQA